MAEYGSHPPAPPEPDWAIPEEPAPTRRRPRRRGIRSQGGGGRRRPLVWGVSAVVVIVVAVVVVVLVVPGSKPAPVTPGSLITTFLPGEIQKVPSSCPSVPSATLSTYLPGKTKQATPPALDGALDSQCDWTLDQRPTYRLLQLDIRAYTPSGLASGTGSATFAAIDAYASAMQEKQDPAPNTGAPKGQLTVIKGLGTAAFTATQVYQVGGAITDVATTVIRYRNVLVTAVLNGLDKSNNGHYGPVSMSELSAGSQAVARAAFAHVGK